MSERYQESASISYRRLPPYKYTLVEPAYFKMDGGPENDIHADLCHWYTDGWFVIDALFPWDGATSAPDLEGFMRPSVLHDAIYRMRQQGYPVPENWKELADRAFNRLCREDGGPRWLRFFARNGIRKFGKADPKELNRYREILVSPK